MPQTAPGMWPSRKWMERVSSTTRAAPAAFSAASSSGGSDSTSGAPGMSARQGPVASGPSSAPSTTKTSQPPIWRSQAPAMRARAPSLQASRIRAPRPATHWSVACTSCPPGAWRKPGMWPAANSFALRTSSA